MLYLHVKYLGQPLVFSNRHNTTCVKGKTKKGHAVFFFLRLCSSANTGKLHKVCTHSNQVSGLFIFWGGGKFMWTGICCDAPTAVGREIINRITWNSRLNHTELLLWKPLRFVYLGIKRADRKIRKALFTIQNRMHDSLELGHLLQRHDRRWDNLNVLFHCVVQRRLS